MSGFSGSIDSYAIKFVMYLEMCRLPMVKSIKNGIPWMLGLITLAYPLVVYFGIQYFTPAILALLLLASAATRFYFASDKKDLIVIIIMSIVMIYILTIFITNNEYLLLLYPGIVSLCVAIFFAASLKQKVSLVERVAIASGKVITVNAKRYTWRLTFFWSGILIGHSAVCFYLALQGTRESWALYSGLICYLLFGMIGVLEYSYRQYYIARYGA
ncbi:hypothetical protein N9091_01105 [bacterium]|nr:hypothetical protein [bacterium]